MRRRQSPNTWASGLRNSTRRPRDSSAPMLFARPKPRFAEFLTTRTSGKLRSTSSAELSADALSTTMCSQEIGPALSFTERRQSWRKGCEFQLTVTTDRVGDAFILSTLRDVLIGEGLYPSRPCI